MFNNLKNRLSQTLNNIRGLTKITEENIEKSIREVRISLLEADVALNVVHNFINNVKKKALGHEVQKSFTPYQEFIKIVKNELTAIMGDENIAINFAVQPPMIILIIGLQGVGKTTTIAKLSNFLKVHHKKKTILVSSDTYRPAAFQQLKTLAIQTKSDIFETKKDTHPIDIVHSALKYAKLKFYDVLLVDTPGYLHINTKMMQEIKSIFEVLNPTETLFVVDAMTGQDAINTAKSFNDYLCLTGIILTKVDGDARGGVALSMRYITGKPIKFIGTGEKIEDFEIFYPNRVVSKILGMGDIVSLIEDIEKNIHHEEAQKLAKKIKTGDVFDLNDFMNQLKKIKNMGGINRFISKLPILKKIKTFNQNNENNEKFLLHMEAIISSMSKKERKYPELIKGSQKRRIANGSGTKVQDVNRLLKQFNDMKRMMKKIKKNGIFKIMRNINSLMTKKNNHY